MTKSLNLIGNICFYMSQNNWNTISPPIIVNGSNFSSIWNKVRKWLSVLNYSVTTPAPTQKDWRKFEGTCYWKVTSSLPIYNKNTSSTIVYDQGANRQRKFILVLLGASFVLIELLFTKKYIYLYVYDTLGINTGFIYFKVFDAGCDTLKDPEKCCCEAFKWNNPIEDKMETL